MKLINEVISKIGDLDYALMEQTQRRLDNLTKPLGSLGRLEELAKHIVGITDLANPSLARKVIITMAGDHGVTEEKVSAYPKEVTPQMVYNFLRGGAGINILAKQVGARVVVVDMGVATPIQVTGDQLQNINIMFRDRKVNLGTKNFTKGPAMTQKEAIVSIQTGIEIVEKEASLGIDMLGTGDMGIGNTTPSAAIISVLTGQAVEKITGRGTGIDNATLKHKIAVIKKGISLNKPNPKDPIDVLAKVGGFEIGGLIGVILAAAARRIPVVVDGFISSAAAMLAIKLAPKVKHFLIASHCSAEKGHRLALEYLGLTPLLDLNLRLGEGTGTALAMHLTEASIRILTEMATFDSAGVSRKV
jgi:nicotinate-nucleotide--dimethylbenzimidazole phosphoribosyltransferase